MNAKNDDLIVAQVLYFKQSAFHVPFKVLFAFERSFLSSHVQPCSAQTEHFLDLYGRPFVIVIFPNVSSDVLIFLHSVGEFCP